MTDRPSTPLDARLAADWITIWQSELASLAFDREAQEAWLTALAAWAQAATSATAAYAQATGQPPVPPSGVARAEPAAMDGAARAGRAAAAGPDAQAGSPAAADASGDGGSPEHAELARLRRHIAELEQRLAASGPSPDPAA